MRDCSGSELEGIRILDIEHTDPHLRESFRNIQERLLAKKNVTEGQVFGYMPCRVSEYKSNYPPFCLSDSILYALQALGYDVNEVALKLGLTARTEKAIIENLHHGVVGKDRVSFLDFNSDGRKIVKKLQDVGLIREIRRPGNLPDLYDKLLEGWRGVLGIPSEEHAIAVLGALQVGTKTEDGCVIIADPLDIFNIDVAPGLFGMSVNLSVGEKVQEEFIRLEEFGKDVIDRSFDPPGIIYSFLFKK